MRLEDARGRGHAARAARFFRTLADDPGTRHGSVAGQARLVGRTLRLCLTVVERAGVPRDLVARRGVRLLAEFARGAMTRGDFVTAAEEAALFHLGAGPRSDGVGRLLLRAFAEWTVAAGVPPAEVRREVERELGETLDSESTGRGSTEL